MLHVWVTSFSFRKGPPEGSSSRGIGSIFDCRHLPSPDGGAPAVLSDRAKEESYLRIPLIAQFKKNIWELVFAQTAEALKAGQEEVYFHFGCVAGEVRSVTFAELLTRDLKKQFLKDIEIFTYHREQSKR